MVQNRASHLLSQIIICTILIALSLSMFLPFLYIFSVSFTSPEVYKAGTIILWPEKWSLEAYRLVLSGSGFINSLQATLFITIIGVPISIISNSGMAYMLAKDDLPGRSIINKLLMFTMLFSPGMIPNYLLIMNLHLINSLWTIILVSACGAWTVMVMKSFFKSLPAELEEAAIIDGCNEMRVFFTIILPLSKAMLATFTLFAAVSYWNTYFSAVMYINDSAKWPLQVFLQQIVMSANSSEFLDNSDYFNKVPTEVLKMAAIIVAIAPIMAVYPFMQKHFAKGVMVGSVKG